VSERRSSSSLPPFVHAHSHASALVLAFFTLLVLVTRLYTAFRDDGVLWPDEVYQSLEQGHRFAFGYGLVPWEFRDGARSWLFPGVLGLLLKGAAWLGATSGDAMVHVAKSFMAVLAAVSTALAMKIAERRAGILASAFAGAAMAVFPASVVFGSRCLSEMASAPLVAFSALLLLDGEASKSALARSTRRAALSGIAIGVAVFCRYQNGLFVIVFLIGLLVARRWKSASAFALAALGAGALGGALDWITWGKPFASFVLYFRFSVLEGRASGWGTEPFDFYARVLFASTGWPIVLLAAFALVASRRVPVLVASVVVFFFAHSFVPHKELRFLLPSVPIFLAASAIGAAMVASHLRSRTWGGRRGARAMTPFVGVTAVAMMVAMGWALPRESFGALGVPTNRNRSVWHAYEGPTRALFRAGLRSDLCGVVLSPESDWGYTFGYTALHRDVPLFRDLDGSSLASANYVIALRGARVPGGYTQVETVDTFALYRRDGSCAPPPAGYSRRLER
jgi:phosphatidylinositol glycan class B